MILKPLSIGFPIFKGFFSAYHDAKHRGAIQISGYAKSTINAIFFTEGFEEIYMFLKYFMEVIGGISSGFIGCTRKG